MTGRVLLTGATGFVGQHLHGPLARAGWMIRCLSRNPARARVRWPGREWVGGDVAEPAALRAELEGCDVLYYLVHGMGDLRPGWEAREVETAERLAREAAAAGVGRIVYLGGVEPVGPPSRHLASRLAVGRVLRGGRVPCVELRAGMIVGTGSASWTIVRDLAARLPAMVLPAWLRNRSEPVALDDVIGALLASARAPLAGAWWDLPGPEALAGKDVLLRVAAVMGRRPVLLEVPLVTPGLSIHWIRLVTRADHRLARELVEGLRSDLLASRPFWGPAGLPAPMALEESARRALAEEPPLPFAAGALEALVGGLFRRR
jgi:uncharacterized protein YbjT (DUF2867 family)